MAVEPAFLASQGAAEPAFPASQQEAAEPAFPASQEAAEPAFPASQEAAEPVFPDGVVPVCSYNHNWYSCKEEPASADADSRQDLSGSGCNS
ncbi:MAG: hypothetical protein HFG64_12395 [Lachnospiraceae bacterium]|nr:hypothetical protein [Lachnospiraceae bacterium]